MVTGLVYVRLYGPDGVLKNEQVVHNLITDTGDLYHAGKVAAAVAPASASAPTALTGMKLGTGTTAAAKNGAGAALGTYLSGSNATFDATYPQVATLGGGLGTNVTYRCTWAPGVATASAITEVVLVTDAAANATSTAGNTVSRCVFSPQDKTAEDTLVIAWPHKFLGS